MQRSRFSAVTAELSSSVSALTGTREGALRSRLITSRSAPGMAFELLDSRLRPPRLSDRSVVRTELLERLNRPDGPPVVIVSAGPGYGKTTVLAQWVASHER